MIRKTDIIHAVGAQLTSLFGEGFPVYEDEEPKDFQRPSAYVSVGTESAVHLTAQDLRRRMDIKIAYFPPVDAYHNTEQAALASASDLILEHFTAPCLPVEARYPEISGCDSVLGADYAEVSVHLDFTDRRPTPEETAQLLASCAISYQCKKE